MEEELFAPSSSSAAEAAFDAVICCILEIMMEEDFQHLKQRFMDQYYQEFDESDENKLSYTSIFNEYVDLLEKPLEQYLMTRIPGFNMNTFTKMLMQHKEEVPNDVLDMLLTFTDFLGFKEMFLEYRATKEGRGVDSSQSLVVTCLNPADSNRPC
ncbi:ADP-ribosylation factor-like protein 2-binding protein [Cyprinodon tularosa]|uniref:ADP-ribosylation factor-like protein 2-binding protein n=1 Tax=Cyprinodon tularosa TaxID=77115 RepID=UPI0018E22DF3|nr:ADP-ribosylation factor-like protein 2-binding protein [Cyprinodon tularosa]XP_038149893.1 ADP-ribosylation factor-like protein 2-binding protein [Cyprinodon tularosa]